MAILCPVQLDPEFGAAYEGLRTVMRIMRVPDIAAEIRRRYHCTPSAVVDGPTLRLQNLRDVSILSTRVNELMAGEIDEGLWLHQLRDEWRAYLWQKVSQERSQHYAGAGRVDRVRTLLYHRRLEERARQGDEDAWAKLGVLRRIIAGGLMTPERASRHKRQDSNRMCSCDAEEETIMHVSWRCALYAEERAHVLESLGCRIEDLPICFTYAMVVPEDFYLNDDVVLLVQEFLVDVWQKHIVRWHAGGDLEDKRRNFPTREITERGIVENGHLLAPRTEGGPVLASEGFLSNDNRLDQLVWEKVALEGFTADGSVENFKRRRQTELKHGRIWAAVAAQTAAIGTTSTRSCLVKTDGACVISFASLAQQVTLRFVSNVARNKLMHSLYGNTSVVSSTRSKWESTLDQTGVQLLHADELKLPGDAAVVTIRADQVSNGAVGFAFCNSVFLQPKLKVKGGSYLCLLIPGVLGADLKRLLQDANPTLLAHSFETVLSLEDPKTKRCFPRSVVGINLGLQNVTVAQLPPSVQKAEDPSVVVWVHAHQRYSPDEWMKCVGSNMREVKQTVSHRIAGLLNVSPGSFEMWGFSVGHSPNSTLKACIRVTATQAKILYDCKDGFLFFRAFVRKGSSPTVEDDIVVLWTNKFTTVSSLAVVANTLQGLRGFVANAQGLGVRIEKRYIAAARVALQESNGKVFEVNRDVAGILLFEVQGFPSGTSAATVVTYVQIVIRPSFVLYFLKKIKKLIISKLPSASEMRAALDAKKKLETEADKARRRQNIIANSRGATCHDDDFDPWRNYKPEAKGKGKGKAHSRERVSAHVASDDSDMRATVMQFRREIDTITKRLDGQDVKFDQMNSRINDNHSEVMQALCSLGKLDDLFEWAGFESPVFIGGGIDPDLQQALDISLKECAEARDERRRVRFALTRVIPKGHFIQDTIADGNCLFRAFCTGYSALTGFGLSHEVARISCIDTLRTSFADRFADFDRGAYLDSMAQLGTYGDELCIAALSKHFEVKVLLDSKRWVAAAIPMGYGSKFTANERLIQHFFDHVAQVALWIVRFISAKAIRLQLSVHLLIGINAPVG
ncbi:unnamed protein product [Symbiodinium sp. CCMP2592]|nr:unnamed protein product [Symbiodinium sp. CCMP2592]